MANHSVLDSNGNEIHSPETLHPGDVLELELAARNLKKAEFAAQLGVKPSHLSELLKGKRHVGASMAIRLETLLGIKAEYWMRVQAAFDLAKARREIRAEAEAMRA
ncbi:MAG: HigA family addiction module antitoxin [Saprospiraceae bacterium]